MAAKEKTIVCVKDGKWFTKTPAPGKRDALRAKLGELGYEIKRECTSPSLKALERMSDDGVATTLMGERTEPDGYGPSGAPSWLMHLGFI